MRAATRPLEHEVDLNDVCRHDGYLFVRNGIGVAGRGRAATVNADDAVDFLAAIDHDDASAGQAGPVALGCLPFRPGAPTDFVIPSVVVRKTSAGGVFVTTIDQPTESDRQLTATSTGPVAASFRVGPRTPIDTYRHAVETGRDAVRRGDLTKVVIAREVGVESDQPLDVHAILLRLRAAFGASYRYSIDGIIGASPELLVAVDGDVVRSHPLAGTTPRTGDPITDEALAKKLVASMKDQVEHRVVIDVVHDALLPWCSYLDWEPEPSVIKVANVQHLGTSIEGRLSEPRPHVVALARLLSPTPALGGHPRREAIDLIEANEGFDRGRYGGAVGWVDSVGNGEFAVTIRCAELSADRRSARLIAGGGIVADSDVDAELAETQAKFQAMVSAIVRP